MIEIINPTTVDIRQIKDLAGSDFISDVWSVYYFKHIVRPYIS